MLPGCTWIVSVKIDNLHKPSELAFEGFLFNPPRRNPGIFAMRDFGLLESCFEDKT
jgi:hypothetical protein